jgi:uncharacterized protein Yka (UPF0111/DUF47 family)
MTLLIFKIFKSQNKSLYSSFNDVSTCLKDILDKTRLISSESDFGVRLKLCNDLVKINKDNKLKLHKIALHLGSSYITPFDREDIFRLIENVNDISSTLLVYAKRVNLFYERAQLVDKNIKAISDLSIDCLFEICNALESLQKFNRDTKTLINTINTLDEASKEFKNVYLYLTNELFEDEVDIKRLIIVQEIYATLEKVDIKCNNFSFLLESLIIKYS